MNYDRYDDAKEPLWQIALGIIGILIAAWGFAEAVCWALDDEERLIREGKQDPRTATFPIINN